MLTADAVASGAPAAAGERAAGAPAAAPREEGNLRAGSAHELFTPDGRLAMPLPRLARRISLTRRNGRATLTFAIAYGVSNRRSTSGVRADTATLRVTVAHDIHTTGPNPNEPVFERRLAEQHLDRASPTRPYRVALSRSATALLERNGWWSSDASKAARARRSGLVRACRCLRVHADRQPRVGVAEARLIAAKTKPPAKSAPVASGASSEVSG